MLQKNENFIYFAQKGGIVMTSIEKYSDRIFENIKPIIMLAKKSVKQ
jgi:hypothetical protein